MRYLMIFALLVPMSASSETALTDFDAGNSAFKSKDYASAKMHYMKCANRWTGCMTQMGVVSFIEGNKEDAIAWFNLAAKYGDETSIGNLRKLGQPIPQRIEAPRNGDDLGALDLIKAILSGYDKADRDRMHCDSIIVGDIVDTDCK